MTETGGWSTYRPRAWLVAALLVSACGTTERRQSGTPGSSDSTVFGDDRARQGDAARAAPEVALLERLVDEYEALDVAMDHLAAPASASAVQGNAWKGDRHEDADKRRLLDLLRTAFAERYLPRTPRRAAGTADSIGSLPKDAGAHALNQLVLAHHRRVHRDIERGLPAVRTPGVRPVLVQLQEHLAREIGKLDGKAL